MVQAARPTVNTPSKSTRPAPRPRALAPVPVVQLPAVVPVPRDYRREDLVTIGEVAFHYVLSGGLELGRELFEGLSAIAPDEPLFALGLGLTYWKLGEIGPAEAAYARAASLDPRDPLPDLSRAELHLERGRRKEAAALLGSAIQKAARAESAALGRKARAMLSLLETEKRT